MRPGRPWLLVLVPFALAGCGASGATGEAAARVIAGDWSYNNDFPGRPDLTGSTITASGVHCPSRSRGPRLVCWVTAHLANGGIRRVRVIVRFDDAGTVKEWKFARPGDAPA